MSCNFIQDNRLWSELEWRFLTSIVYVLLTKKCYQIIPCLSILVKLSLERPVLISVVQSLSCVRLFATSWTTARQASLSITNSWSLLKLMAIESVMPSNHLILCRPLLLPPSIFPSIRSFPTSQLFASHGQSIGASASASVLPMNIHWLISFRIVWFDLLEVQGTLKSLL